MNTARRLSSADSQRIGNLPETIYDRFGGVHESPRELLVLAWMRSGIALEDKAVDTPSGRVEVPQGAVWGSMDSMREDIFASVGAKFTRRQIRYTISKLEDFIEGAELALPETRGKYGKIYKLPNSMTRDEFMANVARKYMLFAYGDPEEFIFSEQVMGNLKRGQARRRRYGSGQKFINWVASEGVDQPAFVSVGRWRLGEEGETGVPVFVPWITIDIDGPDLMVAREIAEEIVYDLHDAGYDLMRCFVSFSGGKGFHVQVSTDQIGSPIFSSSEAATEMMKAFIQDLSDHPAVDLSTASPRTLVRLTGSKHEESGLYKRTWVSRRFLDMSVDETFSDLNSQDPFHFEDPTRGDVEREALEHFMNSADEAERKLQKARKSGRKKTGKVMQAILPGIGEGQQFGPKYFHVGRENACYIVSCWFLEKESTSGEALDRVEKWNERNNPPLPHHALMNQFRGAKRTILE